MSIYLSILGEGLDPQGKRRFWKWHFLAHCEHTHNNNHCFMLFAISKGMQAVKLCTVKILQFLTGGAS